MFSFQSNFEYFFLHTQPMAEGALKEALLARLGKQTHLAVCYTGYT